jgi:hypothetical protein
MIKTQIHPQFITDTAGEKLVILTQQEFNAIIDELEEQEDVRLYDEAKASNEPSIPIEKAFEIIEAARKGKK